MKKSDVEREKVEGRCQGIENLEGKMENYGAQTERKTKRDRGVGAKEEKDRNSDEERKKELFW